MRLSPATKAVTVGLCLALAPALAHAQQLVQTSMTPQAMAATNTALAQAAPAQAERATQTTQQALSRALGFGGGRGGAEQREYYKVGNTQDLSQAEFDSLLADNDSPQAQAERLAAKRKYQRDLEKSLHVDAGDNVLPPPPQDMEDLQDVGEGVSGTALDDAGTDNLPENGGEAKEGAPVIDLRRDAQKEAALSFGARGGLAKRNFQIMERLQGFAATLDKVFDFRALLVKAPSGLLIEPPIVREAADSLIVTAGGNEAAVADRIFDINKQANIVTAPRDWRLYLVQDWVSRVPAPPRLLWPKDAAERARWKRWVALGWRAGTRQADEMFEANLSRLVADFSGMVRYRTLLTQGMISQPYAMHEDRGVTGTKTVMRVGDRALRITGPSQFLTGSDLWKPADR